MKKYEYKQQMKLALILCMVFIISVFLGLVYKKGLFIDEIYTWGLSNGYYTPFLKDVKDGDLIDKVLTKEEIKDYLTVGEKDSFAFDSVYYNQTQDVHPPLYYMILHFMSSIVKNSYSKWTPLLINLLFYLFALLILYKIGNLLFLNKDLSSLLVLIYGMSFCGLSTVLMIRMYILLTLLTILYAFFVIKIYIDPDKKIFYFFMGISMIAGMLSQYYFVIFAFFLSMFFCLLNIKRQRFKIVGLYSLTSFISLAVYYCIWPYIISHLFADKLVSGRNAVEHLFDISQFLKRIYIYTKMFFSHHKLLFFLCAVIVILGMINFKKVRNFSLTMDRTQDRMCFLLFMAALCSFLTIAIISPVFAFRYIYNIAPFLIFGIVYLADIVIKSTEFLSVKLKEKKELFFVIVILAFSLYAIRGKAEYLYSEQETYEEIVKEVSDLPCIYLDDGYSAPVTQDLLCLLQFDEIYITNDFLKEKTNQYLQNKNIEKGVVLYIDIDGFWSSGYDPEKVLNEIISHTDFENYKKLYGYGLSCSYLLQ